MSKKSTKPNQVKNKTNEIKQLKKKSQINEIKNETLSKKAHVRVLGKTKTTLYEPPWESEGSKSQGSESV